MASNNTIQVRRNREVLGSAAQALDFLGRIQHAAGQPVLVTYQGATGISTILAVGLGTGSGPGCYKILSAGQPKVVVGLVGSEADLPGAADIIGGEVYLYTEPVTGTLYWLTLDTETLAPQTEVVDVNTQYHVYDLSTSTEYYIKDGELKKPGDHYEKSEIDTLLENLETRVEVDITGATGTLQGDVTRVLGGPLSSGYPGAATIPGATTFVGADQVLYGKTVKNAADISGLSGRLSKIESEFSGNTSTGLPSGNRLRVVYDWYLENIEAPEYSVEFQRITEGPVLPGSTQMYKAVFKWSWVDKIGLQGIRLEDQAIYFGTTIPAASLEGQVYTWVFQWTVPAGQPSEKTWTAEFIGPSGTSVGTTMYTQIGIASTREAKITWPSEPASDWPVLKTGNYGQAGITFTGSGLPASTYGTKVKIQKNSVDTYTYTLTSEESQTITDQINLDPKVPVTVSALWGTEILASAVFKAHIMAVLDDSEEITLENILKRAKFWYFQDNNLEIPETWYTPNSKLVVLSPYGFTGSSWSVLVKHSKRSGWQDVTSDFSGPTGIQCFGITYQYISFSGVGEGSFTFKIWQ